LLGRQFDADFVVLLGFHSKHKWTSRKKSKNSWEEWDADKLDNAEMEANLRMIKNYQYYSPEALFVP
jgi:hypothetical protein